MRVAVLSDTHTTAGKVEKVMARLRPHLQGAEIILHAGDVTAPELLEALRAIAPVHAVAGNMDGEDIRSVFGEQLLLEMAGHKIGLMHGWGSPGDLPRKIRERFLDEAGKPRVEIIVFGHSHQPLVEKFGDVLMVNPGSATDRFFAPYRSMVFLDLGAEVKAEIIEL